MKFETVEQVEEYIGHPITLNQYIDVLNYLKYGVIPAPDGCTSCDRGVVRRIIGEIQAAEAL